MVDWHTITQHSGDKLGVVPVFRVEFLRQSLHRGLISALVLELEVVALRAVGVGLLDDAALRYGLGKSDTLLVVLQSGEYLVRIAVQQSYESHPLLLVVLETNHVTVEFLRTRFRHCHYWYAVCADLLLLGSAFLLVLL